MKKILIFTYLQRHLTKMLPIIHELKNNRDISLEVLLMTSEEQALAQEHCIAHRMLDEFTTQPRRYDFDLSWGLEPLINAIEQINPDLFLAVEVNFILRNAIRFCRHKKIKSIVIQHGTPNKYSLHAFVPFEGDLFLAWGTFSKDFLIQHNMPPEKVVLTGGVPFDKTLSLAAEKKRIAKALNISANKKWILFTTQASGAGGIPTPREIKEGVIQTALAVANRDDVHLIYQVHPSQPIESIEDLLCGIPKSNYIVCRYVDTEELIKSSEAMITFFSTTAIDAILLKKPLMLINLSDDRDFFPFEKMEVALVVHHAAEIDTAVQRLLNGFTAESNHYEKAAQYINFMNDGNALKRVMSIILENAGV